MKSMVESRRRREPNLSIKEEAEEGVNKTTVTWEDKASHERIPSKAWLFSSKEEPWRAVKMVILGAAMDRPEYLKGPSREEGDRS